MPLNINHIWVSVLWSLLLVLLWVRKKPRVHKQSAITTILVLPFVALLIAVIMYLPFIVLALASWAEWL